MKPSPAPADTGPTDRLRHSEARRRVLAVLAEHPAQSFSSVDLYRRFLAEQSAVSLRTIARALECLGSLGAIQRDEAAPGGSHAWRWHARRGHGGD